VKKNWVKIRQGCEKRIKPFGAFVGINTNISFLFSHVTLIGTMDTKDQTLDNKSDGDSINKQYGGPPVVFMMKSSFFGDKRPERDQWIKNTEVYEALSDVIDALHISGI